MNGTNLKRREGPGWSAGLKGLTLVAVLVALGACGGGSASSGGGEELDRAGLPPAPAGDSASIKVTNNGLAEARLTAELSGRRVRLGTLQANRTEIYMVEIRGTEQVGLEIRVLGGGTCTTRPQPISVGAQINVVIPQNVASMPNCG